MEIYIQWIIVLAWAIVMFFYGAKLYNTANQKGASIIKLLRTSNRESYSAIRAKKFALSMLIATLLAIMGLMVTYFVESQS